MTFRRDRFALAPVLALLLVLAGCSEAATEANPFDVAIATLQRGDGVAAEAQLRGLLEEGADRDMLAPYLGQSELLQANLAEARYWLGEGKFAEDTASHGFHMLGRLEMEDGNLPAAGQAFDRAINAGGEDAGLWVDIARLRYRGGEQAQAFDAAARALELGPDDAEALALRGRLMRDTEGASAALGWFERALDTNPDDPELLGDYAASLGETGRARDMLVAIRHLVRIDPGNRKAFYLQSVLAARAGNYSLANRLLQRSGFVDRNVPAALLLSGIIGIEQGNYASAAAELAKLDAQQPDNRRVSLLLARALSLGRNDRELVSVFGDRAKRASASPYLQTLVARSYEALGDRKAAAALVDRSAQLGRPPFATIGDNTPLAVAATKNLDGGTDALRFVRAAITQKQAKRAVATAQRFEKRFSGSGDARVLLADTRLAAGARKGALASFRAAAEIRNSWPIAYKTAALLASSGQQDESAQTLQRFAKGQPFNIEALTMLAQYAALRGDWDMAAQYADTVLATGAARDTSLLLLRAEIARQTGDLEAAVLFAETTHDMLPMNGDAARLLAELYTEIDADSDVAEIAALKAKVLTR